MCNSGCGCVYSRVEAGGPLNHADLPPTSSGKNYRQQQLSHLHRTWAPCTINKCHCVCTMCVSYRFYVSFQPNHTFCINSVAKTPFLCCCWKMLMLEMSLRLLSSKRYGSFSDSFEGKPFSPPSGCFWLQPLTILSSSPCYYPHFTTTKLTWFSANVSIHPPISPAAKDCILFGTLNNHWTE